MSLGPSTSRAFNASGRVVGYLRERGATSSATSVPVPHNLLSQPALQRMISRSVLVEAHPGHYYLNEIAVAFNRTADRTRARLALISIVSAGLAIGAACWVGRS